MIKTYLAGPINHKNPASFEYAKKWRKTVTEILKKWNIQCLDPLDRVGGDSLAPELRCSLRTASHTGDLNTVRQIVGDIIIPPDLKMVEESTFITLYLPLKDDYETCGTYGEATLAKYLNIPIFIVTERENNTIPEWLTGCSTAIFKCWEDYYVHVMLNYHMVKI
jgi:hypothetical protein